MITKKQILQKFSLCILALHGLVCGCLFFICLLRLFPLIGFGIPVPDFSSEALHMTFEFLTSWWVILFSATFVISIIFYRRGLYIFTAVVSAATPLAALIILHAANRYSIYEGTNRNDPNVYVCSDTHAFVITHGGSTLVETTVADDHHYIEHSFIGQIHGRAVKLPGERYFSAPEKSELHNRMLSCKNAQGKALDLDILSN